MPLRSPHFPLFTCNVRTWDTLMGSRMVVQVQVCPRIAHFLAGKMLDKVRRKRKRLTLTRFIRRQCRDVTASALEEGSVRLGLQAEARGRLGGHSWWGQGLHLNPDSLTLGDEHFTHLRNSHHTHQFLFVQLFLLLWISERLD